MTIPEIIKELEIYTGKFPMEAMKAAVQQREAITPVLLGVLEAVAANPLEFVNRQDYMAHLYALYLLAQFREKRAYAPIIKIFSAPGETPFDLAGDTVTEGLGRIFGSVYDGNPVPLHGLVESEEVNEYVRNAALEALVVLEHSGQMNREEVVGYFRSLFHGKLKRTYSYAWEGLVSAVANLPAPELIGEVRQTFQDDLAEGGDSSLQSIEVRLLNPDQQNREFYSIITNAIDEMEWWASIHPEESEEPEGTSSETAAMIELAMLPPPLPVPTSYTAPKPVVRQPKIGRNDPCPCGSGKKYKKCCGKS